MEATRRKICLVIPTIGVGGAERVVIEQARLLADAYEVTILIRPGAARLYRVPDGCQIAEAEFDLETLRAFFLEQAFDLIVDHFHWDIKHVKSLALLSQEGFRILLVEHNAFHYPMFQHTRDGQADHAGWIDGRYEYYRELSGVCLLNDDALRFFERHLENCVVIENPAYMSVDLDSRPPAEGRSDILHVTHFGKKAKRVDLFYQAIADYRARGGTDRVQLVGNYRQYDARMNELLTGLKPGDMTYVGRTSDVDAYYRRAGVMTMTSEIEGQPMVILEAACNAVPQVCFDIPGMSCMIKDGETGFLVPFGDMAAYGDALFRLSSDPNLRERMGWQSRDFVLDLFAPSRIRDKWIATIEEVLEVGRIHRPKPAVISPAVEEQDRFWRGYWDRVAHHAEGSRPRISFLVPVYGTENVLGRCLDSIRRQTEPDFECLVVDDASPGNVTEIFDEMVGEDHRFRLIHHDRNRGLYQARSTAAAVAQGLYLANIDSDDYISPNFAKEMLSVGVQSGAEIVECNAIEFDEEGNAIHFNSVAPHKGLHSGANAFRAFLNGSIRNVVWNKIYLRDLWLRTAAHNQIDKGISIAEDTLRNTYLFSDAASYAAIDECLYYYCRRGTSVVKGGDFGRLRKKLDDLEHVYDMCAQRCIETEDERAYIKIREKYVTDLTWYAQEYIKRVGVEVYYGEVFRARGGFSDERYSLFQLLGRYSTLAETNASLHREVQSAQSREHAAWQAAEWERERVTALEAEVSRETGFLGKGKTAAGLGGGLFRRAQRVTSAVGITGRRNGNEH